MAKTDIIALIINLKTNKIMRKWLEILPLFLVRKIIKYTGGFELVLVKKIKTNKI